MSGTGRSLVWPVILLALQNFTIFWNHYFRGYGFPWDFSQAYFAMNAFSARALEHGLLPQWLPFQCMGYPYPLNLQSGLYYPPLWIFALLHLSYDLRAATVLQCLTVLFGAVGMFMLLRRLVASQAYAVVGAFMFQFFGGFYSNAQHTDIIRSFALVPWLFLAFTIDEESAWFRTASRRLLPLFVYFAATGGYPGNLISTSLVLGVYLILQLADAIRGGRSPWLTVGVGSSVAGLFLLGIAMAAVHLGPAWVERAHLARAGAQLRYRSLWIEDLPLLFFSPTPMGGEPSMTSTFLTIPGLFLVFFVSWKWLKESWIWSAILVISVLMVAGDRSFFWTAVAALAEPVRLSRFPSSDYRPLIAVALIVLAGLGLRSLSRAELGLTSFALRGAAAFAAVAAAGRAVYGSWLARPVVMGLIIALASLVILAWIRTRPQQRWGRVAIVCLLALITLDALRVLPDMKTWRDPEIASLYEKRGWVTPSTAARALAMFHDFPTSRPAREEPKHRHWYSWAGYLEGRPMMTDKTPCLLRSTAQIFQSPGYKLYMSREWTPLTLPAPAKAADTVSITVGYDAFESALERAERGPPAIRQTRYGIDQISYRVSLAQQTLMVENEMYFPGWEAILDVSGHPHRIRAVDVNGIFRAWVLPVGTYSMVASFRLPHMDAYRVISAACLAIWLVLLIVPVVAWNRGRAGQVLKVPPTGPEAPDRP